MLEQNCDVVALMDILAHTVFYNYAPRKRGELDPEEIKNSSTDQTDSENGVFSCDARGAIS